jgi:hypothetical protein
MSEPPVMPDVNAPISVTCSGGCQNHGTLTAVFYTPIFLLFGGFAALATFPEIAEYATPWIGESVGQHVCPSVNRASTGPSSSGITAGCSNPVCSTSVAEGAACCDHSELPGCSHATNTSEESTSTHDYEISSEVTLEESPADALSSANTDASAFGSN